MTPLALTWPEALCVASAVWATAVVLIAWAFYLINRSIENKEHNR